MSDKYISVTELKQKLNYIFRANGVSKCTREAINGVIKKLPFVFKEELETTLEASSELKTIEPNDDEIIRLLVNQSVTFIPKNDDIKAIQRDAIINFVEKYKEEITKRYEDIAYKDLFFGVIDNLVKEMAGGEP